MVEKSRGRGIDAYSVILRVNNNACRIFCVGYSRYIVALGGFKVGDHLHKLVLDTAE